MSTVVLLSFKMKDELFYFWMMEVERLNTIVILHRPRHNLTRDIDKRIINKQ